MLTPRAFLSLIRRAGLASRFVSAALVEEHGGKGAPGAHDVRLGEGAAVAYALPEAAYQHDMHYFAASTIPMTSAAWLLASGAGTSVIAFLDVVVLEPQGAAHRRVHLVHAGDVGELEDLDVPELPAQRVEDAVGHAAALEHEAIGVGEHGAFER